MYNLTWFGKIFRFIVFILLTDAFANQILTMTPRQNSPPSKGWLPITTRHHFSKNLFSLSRKGGRKLYIDIGFQVWVKFPVKLCCCYEVTFLHPAMSNIVLTLESENQFGFGWLFCGMFSACSLENCVEDKCLHAFCCTGENGTTCNTFAHFMPQCLLDKNSCST